MEFFKLIYECECEGNLERKFALFNELYRDFKNGVYDGYINSLSTSDENKIKDLQDELKAQNELKTPSYESFCDVYSLQDLPKIKGDKRASLLHSVAHIEYSAIDIALDATCRFVGLPREYYADWLEVASDEMRHFGWLCEQMDKLGLKYGKMPVHNGLFVAMQRTQDSLLDRMALLPRHMEASGLDANLNIRAKMEQNDGLISVLKHISDEEITHVAKGDKWFKYACAKSGTNPANWLDIVLSYYPRAFANSRDIDEISRLKCGFSEDEIKRIKALGAKKEQN